MASWLAHALLWIGAQRRTPCRKVKFGVIRMAGGFQVGIIFLVLPQCRVNKRFLPPEVTFQHEETNLH